MADPLIALGKGEVDKDPESGPDDESGHKQHGIAIMNVFAIIANLETRCARLQRERDQIELDLIRMAERNEEFLVALEEIEAMCGHGESHTWIARVARKALANEEEK